jgi:WD40 repeat protein
VGFDGTVYAGSFDGTVQVWSGEDGTHIRTLSGHRCNRASVHALVVGVNDKLYTGSDDSTIRVWSTRDGAHIQTLEGHADSVVALLLRLDGRIYSASEDGTIRVWSGDDGAHLQTLEGHEEVVTSMAWGPDGKLYSGSLEGGIRVWSDDGSTTIFKTTNYGDVYSLAWTDGDLLAILDESILVWSSDQLGLSDSPICVLHRWCGNLVVGPSGNVYVGTGNAILKL